MSGIRERGRLQFEVAGVFDPLVGALNGRSWLLIEGAKISKVGARPQPGVEVNRKYAQAYAVPGLIDCHVHLSFDPSVNNPVDALERSTAAEVADVVRRMARLALLAGVTTVRDLGDPHYLVSELRRELLRVPAPTIVSSGPPITTANGHCHFFGGAVTPSGDHLQRAVAERAKRGVDVVKVMINGGILTPGSNPGKMQFSRAALAEIASAAKSDGLPIAAHAYTSEGISAAIQMGASTIEHCSFVTHDEYLWDWEAIVSAAQSPCYISPTLVDRPGVRQDPSRLSWRKSMVQHLYHNGAKLVAGTDSGVLRGLGPDSLPWALLAMHDAGIPSLECIAAGTIRAAEACGLSGTKGLIAAGYDADLVLVEKDPARNLGTLVKPLAVVARGKLYDPEG
ncbi:amidohydrolase family protein [Micromonospora arida]|uniref:amidohydrolase family protein n=1 Tax=Micromonospora arida TaxID=2203715 RepID=UPI0033B9B826